MSYLTRAEAVGILSLSDIPDDPRRTAPPDDDYAIAARRRELERDEYNDTEEWDDDR